MIKDNVALIGFAILSLLFIISMISVSSSGVTGSDVNISGFDSNKVMVSSNDTTAGYLNGKLVAGSNITLTENNDGGNETLTIASTASGGGGTGRTYTSGTPATIQVNNDTNTISQNFDGNFNSRASNLFPINDANITSMSWTKLDPPFPTNCATNEYATGVTNTAMDCLNFQSTGLEGGGDIDSLTGNVVFQNNNNRLFGTDILYVDVNSDLITPLSSKIIWDSNTVLDGRYKLISSSTDGNGSILGTTNQVSVTNGLSRLVGGDNNVVLSLPQNIDTLATPTFAELTLSLGSGSCFNINTGAQQRFDVDCSTNITTSGTHLPNQPGTSDIGNSSNRWDDLFITDINATGTNDFKTLCIGGDCKTSWPVSVSSDTNCSTSGDCNSMYIQKNPLVDQNINNQDLNIYDGQLVLHAGNNIALSNNNILEIWNQNGTRVARFDQNGNMVLDGNITFIDANSYIGGTGSTQGRRVRVNALDYTSNATTDGVAIWVNANTYPFAVTATLTSGLYYSATSPRGFHWRIDGLNKIILGAGSPNTEGAIWQILRTANPSGSGTQIEGWTFLKDIGIVDFNAQPYTYRQGVYQHLNSRMYLGTPNDLIIDANWNGDINAKGDYQIDGNMIVDHNIYGQLISPGNLVGVSCNTTCGAYSYGGPWTCVEATNITGATSSCSDTTVAHNCLCRN